MLSPDHSWRGRSGTGRCQDVESLSKGTDFAVEREGPRLRPPGSWFIAGICVLMIAVSGLGVWLVYLCVSTSLQAESNLHYSFFALQLVERFVAQRGRWPSGWAELEQMEAHDVPFGLEWPSASAEIQRRVSIDFAVDLTAVAQQDRMNFTAIRPKGPHFEYRDYGYVDSLQAAIRKSVSTNRPKVSNSPLK